MEQFEPKKQSIENHRKLANQLNDLQNKENEGRGISCVKTIVTYLQNGDIETAKAICRNESDKINSYEDVKNFLITNLYKDEKNHPWYFSEKL